MLVENIRFADDTVLLASSAKQLQDMIQSECNLPTIWHVDKRKNKNNGYQQEKPERLKIIVNGYHLKQVDHYTYLGSIISNDGRCLEEVKKRIAQAKSAFWKNKKIIRRNININLKLRILSCYVNSVATNGSKTWTYSRKIPKKINDFEMWT